jgi:hypothetical protein
MFRQGDFMTADECSKHIGEEETTEWHRSETRSSSEERTTSTGKSEHVSIKRKVLARDLMDLHDLHAYVQIGHFPYAKVRFPVIKSKRLFPALLPRRPNDPPTAAAMYDQSRGRGAPAQPAPLPALEAPVPVKALLVLPPVDASPSKPAASGLDLSALEALAGSAAPSGGAPKAAE